MMTNKNKLIVFSTGYLLLVFIIYIYPFSDQFSLNRHQIISFRGDHVMHLLVFTPVPFILHPFFYLRHKNRNSFAISLALVIAASLELIHYILPYRSFTTADLLANILGVGIGSILMALLTLVKKRN